VSRVAIIFGLLSVLTATVSLSGCSIDFSKLPSGQPDPKNQQKFGP
jgi:hypothetical protein